jgi:hypothetical protein
MALNMVTQHMNTRQLEARKTTARTFHCKASAIKGRFDVEFETGAPNYVKFGAVLTKREVRALIECLVASVRKSED